MRVLILSAGLLVAAAVQGQTMYRCGSVYQDRPCDAGRPGKALGSTSSRDAAAPSAGVDADCVQRARDSNRIVWAREGGATEERLLSEAKSEGERRLIRDVYRRPGAASTVQAAVETDCVAEKRRLEQETALAVAAALKAQREGSVPASSAGTASATSSLAAPEAPALAAQRHKDREAEREAEERRRLCARYKDEMENLRRAERSGGSAAVMDGLNERRRNLRDRMSGAGC